MRACACKRPPCPFHSRRSKIRGTAELRHKRFAIEGFKFDSTGLSDESTAHQVVDLAANCGVIDDH